MHPPRNPTRASRRAALLVVHLALVAACGRVGYEALERDAGRDGAEPPSDAGRTDAPTSADAGVDGGGEESRCGDGLCEGRETPCDCTADCGGPACGDGFCCVAAGETQCGCASDCGPGSCGDGCCGTGESAVACPSDCETVCGDGICAGEESTASCPEDCGAACGDGTCSDSESACGCGTDCAATCGDGCCTAAESSATCPGDCGASCGDGACNAGETTCSCPGDCGATCGDGCCGGSESTGSCPADCGALCGDGTCNGTESTCGCPADCGDLCGDGCCTGSETACTCSADCPGMDLDGDGIADVCDPAPDPVVRQAVATGQASDPDPASPGGVRSVATDVGLPTFDGLYVAAVATTPNEDVGSVSGFGLTWTQLAERCAGATRVEVWAARGTPSFDDVVTATLATGAFDASSLVLAAAVYTGVHPSAPTGDVQTTNAAVSNGQPDCTEHYGDSTYSLSLTAGSGGAVTFGAVAIQDSAHDAGGGFSEAAERAATHPSFPAGVAIVDRTSSSAEAVTVQGTLSAGEDYAVAAVEIRP